MRLGWVAIICQGYGGYYRKIKICSSFFNHLTTLSSSVIYGFFGSKGKPIKKQDVQIKNIKVSLNPIPRVEVVKFNSSNIVLGKNIAIKNKTPCHKNG